MRKEGLSVGVNLRHESEIALKARKYAYYNV
jgi:hypothetical protein